MIVRKLELADDRYGGEQDADKIRGKFRNFYL